MDIFTEKLEGQQYIYRTYIVFLQATFSFLEAVLCTRTFFSKYISSAAWFSVIYLMLDAIMTMFSLIVLDFSPKTAKSYMILSGTLTTIRTICLLILLGEFFIPTSLPSSFVPMAAVTFGHCAFAYFSLYTIYNVRKSCQRVEVEEIEVANLHLSDSSLSLLNNMAEDE